jgi:hypothetical protein
MSARQLFQGVLIASPADFSKLAGYIDDFDPSQDPIDLIEYHYEFPGEFRCSNAHCHQQHRDGFLVRLKSTLLSNVGWVCASKADAGFDHKVNQFFQERQIPLLRAQVLALKHASPSYEAKLGEIENAAWPLIKQKRAFQKLFPSIVELLSKNQYADSFSVTRTIREKHSVVDQYGKEKEVFVPTEEVIAQVSGIRFLRESLGPIITELIRPALQQLQGSQPATMSYPQLRKCFSNAQNIDEWLELAIQLQRAGERLMSQESEAAIKKLTGSATVQEEARRFALNSLQLENPQPTRKSKPLSRKERRARRIY